MFVDFVAPEIYFWLTMSRVTLSANEVMVAVMISRKLFCVELGHRKGNAGEDDIAVTALAHLVTSPKQYIET